VHSFSTEELAEIGLNIPDPDRRGARRKKGRGERAWAGGLPTEEHGNTWAIEIKKGPLA